MSYNRKRSLSPTSLDRPSYVEGIKKIMGIFKKPQPSESVTLDVTMNNDDVMFDKRRRISIQQTNEFKGSKPRSSIDYTVHLGNSYSNYLHRLEEEVEEINANIERRATLVPQIDEKYESPIPDMVEVKRTSQDLIDKLDVGEVSEPESEEESYDQLIVADGLYTDEEGNVVRPPFINLDPQERYQLLQLKRAIEVSKEIQSKLKYSLDPHETTSIVRANNKVDTATQTFDGKYLKNKLNFFDLIAKKKQKTNGGAVFSGEFLYDVEETKPIEQTQRKLSGYLGTISKPKFTQDNSKRDFSGGKVSLDSDYVEKTEKLSDLIKVKESKTVGSVQPSSGFNFKAGMNSATQPVQSDQILVSAKPVEPQPEPPKPPQTLVPDQTQKKRSRDDPEPESTFKFKPVEAPAFSFGKSDKPEQAIPSFGSKENTSKASGFSFGKPETSTSKTEAPKFSFEKNNAEKKTLGFSFGSKPEDKVAPTFSFGSKSEKEAPKFSFGSKPEQSKPEEQELSSDKSETPKFSFGSNEKKEETPKFSFGAKPEEKKETPAFNFGNKPEEKKEASGFTFGSKPEEKKEAPAFSFGSKSEEKKEAPAFSFGSKSEESEKKEAPAFSFGSKPEEKKEAPTFSFGSQPEEKKETPSFSFGSKPDDKKDTPTLSFGSKPEEKKETPTFSFGSKSEEKKEAPAFSFGSKPEGTEKKDTPTFTFGAKPEEKKETAFSFGAKPEEKKDTPTFSFGNKPEEKKDTPTFNFGAKPEEKKETTFSFGKSETPTTKPETKTFSFGKSETPTFGEKKDTGFNFGSSTKPTAGPSTSTAPTPGGFNFGAVEKPSFNFGSTEKPKSVPPMGGFNFGAVEKPSFGSPFAKSVSPSVGTGVTPAGFRSQTGTPDFTAGFNQFGQAPNQFGQPMGQSQNQFGQPMQAQGQFQMGQAPNQFGQPMGQQFQMGNQFAQPMGQGQGQSASPLTPIARPNRKIAQMRKRRGM